MPLYLFIIFSPPIFKILFDKYVFIVILNVQLIPFLLCFFLFLFLQLDNFLLFYACVLFFIFVNLLLYFDLWLPCFSSLLTSSYICLLWWSYRLKNIVKNKKNYIFLLLPFYTFEVLFYIFMFIISFFLVFTIFHK